MSNIQPLTSFCPTMLDFLCMLTLLCVMLLVDHLLLQRNPCNLTDTGREILCLNRQAVQLHSGKNIENSQMEININQNQVKQ